MYRESGIQTTISSLIGLVFAIVLLLTLVLAIRSQQVDAAEAETLQNAIDTVETYVCESPNDTLYLFEDQSWDCRP